jgi:polyisoprenoid-binding protein YceI
MKYRSNSFIFLFLILLCVFTHVSCTHEDEIAPSVNPEIEFGNAVVTVGDKSWKHDKTHSSVLWETAYLGQSGLLTGRFNSFSVTNLIFDEGNPQNTSFEGWVRLNSVNTGEPGRDAGCLLGTFGTATGLANEERNLARLKSKKVEFSKTDRSYVVTFDMTFLGNTKEYTGKLNYTPPVTIPASGTAAAHEVLGLQLRYQFLAKTDFDLVSPDIADKVDVTLNMNFNNK